MLEREVDGAAAGGGDVAVQLQSEGRLAHSLGSADQHNFTGADAPVEMVVQRTEPRPPHLARSAATGPDALINRPKDLRHRPQLLHHADIEALSARAGITR